MSRYGVLTGDVIGSTGMGDWRTVSSHIGTLLKALNKELKDSIVMDFHVTTGDEFQGAIMDPPSLFHAFRELRLRMPVAFRCGMGVGGIETPGGDAASMRGEAFYRARKAIETAKRSGRRFRIVTSRNATSKDLALNALLAFIDDIESHWTERQAIMAKHYLLLGRPMHQDVATHFGVTPQSVSQTLRASRVSLIEEGEGAILSLLGGTNMRSYTKVKLLDSRN
jgi:hypothetical protein